MNKETVLEFFRDQPESAPERFNKACELYRQSPGKNTNIERSLNISGYNAYSLETVEHELQKLHGITDLEKIKPEVTEEKSEASIVENFKVAVIGAGNINLLYAIKLAVEFPHLSIVNLLQSKALVAFEETVSSEFEAFAIDFGKQHNLETSEVDFEDVELAFQKILAETPFPDNIEQELKSLALQSIDGNSSVAKNVGFEILNIELSPAPKFRDEYPFLNEPDCPNELKILVADKLTAYKAYQAAHEKLAQANAGIITLMEDEKLELAKTATESFARSEAIKAELDHYQEKKEVLGKDPIFRQLVLEREVAEMDNEACLKFINSTVSYVSRKNKAINDALSEDLKAKLQGELDARLEKLALVKKKAGVS
jgi:hypothetical protein